MGGGHTTSVRHVEKTYVAGAMVFGVAIIACVAFFVGTPRLNNTMGLLVVSAVHATAGPNVSVFFNCLFFFKIWESQNGGHSSLHGTVPQPSCFCLSPLAWSPFGGILSTTATPERKFSCLWPYAIKLTSAPLSLLASVIFDLDIRRHLLSSSSSGNATWCASSCWCLCTACSPG
jgi:hypothetical protein